MAIEPELDTTPIRIAGRPKDFFVEVCDDEMNHGIIVGAFDNFDQALGEYRERAQPIYYRGRLGDADLTTPTVTSSPTAPSPSASTPRTG